MGATSIDDLAEGDWRRSNPRFQGENFERNLEIVERIREMADEKGCTPAQLALAWVSAQGEDVVPIPGTRRRERIDENAAAVSIELSADDLERIGRSLPSTLVAGTRYPEASMGFLNG